MLSSLVTIDAQTENFVFFTAVGRQHCVTPREEFYTLEQNGLRFVEWLSMYLAGETNASVSPSLALR